MDPVINKVLGEDFVGLQLYDFKGWMYCVIRLHLKEMKKRKKKVLAADWKVDTLERYMTLMVNNDKIAVV